MSEFLEHRFTFKHSKCIELIFNNVSVFFLFFYCYRKSLVFLNQSQRSLMVTWTLNGPNIFIRYCVMYLLSLCAVDQMTWHVSVNVKYSEICSCSSSLLSAVLSVLFWPRLFVTKPGLPLRGRCLIGWHQAWPGSGAKNKGGALRACIKPDCVWKLFLCSC